MENNLEVLLTHEIEIFREIGKRLLEKNSSYKVFHFKRMKNFQLLYLVQGSKFIDIRKFPEGRVNIEVSDPLSDDRHEKLYKALEKGEQELFVYVSMQKYVINFLSWNWKLFDLIFEI